jgi:hypothetical protein
MSVNDAKSQALVNDENVAVVTSMVQALCAGRLEEAEHKLAEVGEACGRSPDDENILVFRVLIAVQKGAALEALCYLNNLEHDPRPELRALCMNRLGDPLWQGLASELAESSPKPRVRDAMNVLLGRAAQSESAVANCAE